MWLVSPSEKCKKGGLQALDNKGNWRKGKHISTLASTHGSGVCKGKAKREPEFSLGCQQRAEKAEHIPQEGDRIRGLDSFFCSYEGKKIL